MKEMPFWLTSGPDVTETAAGIGAARAAGRRGRRQRKEEAFMMATRILSRIRGLLIEELW